MSQTPDSFDEYLQTYENHWKELEENADKMVDYPNRTLYTTWMMTFNRIESQSVEAAKLLKLLAYLDHQDIWYELLSRGAFEAPQWFQNMVANKPAFNNMMRRLCNYSLVDAQIDRGGYSLHACVRD